MRIDGRLFRSNYADMTDTKTNRDHKDIFKEKKKNERNIIMFIFFVLLTT